MNSAKILIVDDEKAIVQMLEFVLRKEGFEHIYTADNAEDGMQLLLEYGADIILLDVMLPDRTGFELGPQIRAQSDAHLIYLTARTTDLDRLTGFAVGGDDYVTKPFNPLEIAARIKARLRRGIAETAVQSAVTPNADPRQRYDFGDLSLMNGPVSCLSAAGTCPALPKPTSCCCSCAEIQTSSSPKPNCMNPSGALTDSAMTIRSWFMSAKYVNALSQTQARHVIS